MKMKNKTLTNILIILPIVFGVFLIAPSTFQAATIDTIPPSAPTGLSARIYSSSQIQIKLSWTASTDNIAVAGYNIYRYGDSTYNAYYDIDGTIVGTTIANADRFPSYQDTDVIEGKSYIYRVSAYDGDGNESKKATLFAIKASKTCTFFSFSRWFDCAPNGQQTRQAFGSPSGCSGGNPTVTRSCEYELPKSSGYNSGVISGGENSSDNNALGENDKEAIVVPPVVEVVNPQGQADLEKDEIAKQQLVAQIKETLKELQKELIILLGKLVEALSREA